MAETKTEFVKRKKSEKRLQAERQVKEAYAKVEECYIEDEVGEKESVKRVVLNGKDLPWRIKMKPEIEDIYSTIDISKALGIKRERMREWMIRGFVEPSLPSTGKGTIAIFTRKDVLCVALFQKLLGLGFNRETASEHVRKLIESRILNTLSFMALVYTVRNEKPVIDFYTQASETYELKFDQNGGVKLGAHYIQLQDWEGVHILNFLKLEDEVDAALAKLE